MASRYIKARTTEIQKAFDKLDRAQRQKRNSGSRNRQQTVNTHHYRSDSTRRTDALSMRTTTTYDDTAFNDPGGSRTRDLRIKSPLLYQLSYRVYHIQP